MKLTGLLFCISWLSAHGALVYAQTAGELPRLPEVIITGERLPRLEESASQFLITPEDIQLLPPARPGNILRVVPGFVTIDHSGGGVKADQYLLRGFDADHGTDVAFFMDGMPINIRSHAHGQGYTDLNFIIPGVLAGHRRRQRAILCRVRRFRGRRGGEFPHS